MMSHVQPSAENAPEPLFSCPIFEINEREQIGRSGCAHKRYVIRHPGGVGILPILPDGRVLLIQQYRAALDRRIYEIPAGTREPNEEPVVTAARELAEETGYRAETFTKLPSFYSSPGFLTEKVHIFAATGLTRGESALEDGEDLSLYPVELATAMKMIENGEIEDGKTLVALLAYRLMREK